MSKISERLEGYQTQMSIYAEQHKIILASDVLDMIEQLQDDLKDTIDDIVAEIEEDKFKHPFDEDEELINSYIDRAIKAVRKGGVE